MAFRRANVIAIANIRGQVPRLVQSFAAFQKPGRRPKAEASRRLRRLVQGNPGGHAGLQPPFKWIRRSLPYTAYRKAARRGALENRRWRQDDRSNLHSRGPGRFRSALVGNATFSARGRLSWRLADRASIDAAQVRAMKRDAAPPEAIMLRSTASSPWRRIGMARQTTHN
jgi:hypothetical protein